MAALVLDSHWSFLSRESPIYRCYLHPRQGARTSLSSGFCFLAPAVDFESRRSLDAKIRARKMSRPQMNSIICNQCFTPTYRGQHPYHITQCGHISCQNCLRQVQNRCPQCERAGIVSIALEEPLSPKLMPYFQPSAELLETMLKVDTFNSTQLNITLQRFYDLDKKYEILKARYWMQIQNMKTLLQKYNMLKATLEKQKKILLMVKRGSPRSVRVTTEQTPSDSGISVPASSSKFSLNSSRPGKSSIITPMPEMRGQYRTADGFCIPVSHKPNPKFNPRTMLS
ncbi:PREDICTED: RING finger protein 212B isoform X2 [Vollenhovia emeryi]|uniref:RING finger protein 212B isoform X2 n=1 Tax=Vollenhovia emeryi TaxID=411798 RepID=UPI0005F46DCE|nr:PREDICTED: RING finger protein 212B isoform X2 [Vollenhovia emeryi]